MDPSRIREKIGRFRILVIGRANAGKTTILERVCNTRDNPEIYNSAGEKIDPAVLKASKERGEHNIENEMVFQSNPGFVFHDSRGFEAGGASEFEMVKAFISSRSKETKITKQLHAIWYCIPMDEASRSFTAGENKFFSQCDTGTIPVIVLFTKFDALYDVEFAKLRKEGRSWKDARKLAPEHAEESFANGPQLKFLKEVRWPPKCHVCLPNMDKYDADCGTLMERTAGTLDNEVLRQLFVSTQQTNLEICMKYGVERTLKQHFDSAETTASKGYERIIETLGAWFPHILALSSSSSYYSEREIEVCRSYFEYEEGEIDRRNELDIHSFDQLHNDHCVEIWSRLLSAASDSSPPENIAQLISAAVIIFEHSFYISDKRRYLQDKKESDPLFHVALEQYMASPHAAGVREAVSAAVQAYEETVATAAHAYEEAVATAAHAYEEAVKTAVFPYQGKLPALMAKLPIERFKRKAQEAFERSQEAKQSFERSQKAKQSSECSQAKEKESSCSQEAKAELFKAVLEIALDHRLPRP